LRGLLPLGLCCPRKPAFRTARAFRRRMEKEWVAIRSTKQPREAGARKKRAAGVAGPHTPVRSGMLLALPPMDRGRFNSWRLLLYTRAITPPRVLAGAWLGSMSLRRGAWYLLLLGAVLAAGVAVRLNHSDPPVQVPTVDPPPISEPLGHAPPGLRW
jgi:hypothetical protein